MIDTFDRIVLAVPNLPAAIEQYQQFLGKSPWLSTTVQDEPRAWWGLDNTVIELVQCDVRDARLQGLIFSSPTADQAEMSVANPLGLDIRLCDGRATQDFRRLRPESQCPGLSVDHVVLRTEDAQACIALFGVALGIRLALDKTVPEWGGRMLFFRTGKLTLEVIESAGQTDATAFWGLAYQCQELEGVARSLAERGVSMSEIRDGRKPGTLVTTVKSHCLGIPTLLVQPAK